MPTSEITGGKREASRLKKKLRKRGVYIKEKVYREETPTAYGYRTISWSKTKRPGFKKY